MYQASNLIIINQPPVDFFLFPIWQEEDEDVFWLSILILKLPFYLFLILLSVICHLVGVLSFSLSDDRMKREKAKTGARRRPLSTVRSKILTAVKIYLKKTFKDCTHKNVSPKFILQLIFLFLFLFFLLI